MVRAWSYGEVKKPETINYRTLRPEKDGLFCERIFGTTKEWECYCGKFKSIRYKGVICDRCGVEVTHFKVRRERMGHIELAAPVSHIWFYRSVPSRIGPVPRPPGGSPSFGSLSTRSTSSSTRATPTSRRCSSSPRRSGTRRSDRYGGSFTAGMGAEAIRSLLEQINMDELAAELRVRMIEKGPKSDKRLLKRIEICESFRNSDNKPEWMVLDVIPVIPPELDPWFSSTAAASRRATSTTSIAASSTATTASSDCMALNAPDIIIRNEKRMLQEAVDALFDNSKKKRVVKGAVEPAAQVAVRHAQGQAGHGSARTSLASASTTRAARSSSSGPSSRCGSAGSPPRWRSSSSSPSS